MKIFQAHTLSKIFRKMTDSEFSELVKDIKENGQSVKGLIYEGMILDGNQRQRACIEAGIEFQWKEFRGSKVEAIAEVLSLNLHRRHLNDSERACVAAEVAKLYPRTNAYTSIKNGVRGRAIPRVSEMMNVSQRKVREAIFLKSKHPEEFEKCKNGELKVGPVFKSIYRDLNEVGTIKKPNMFSSDMDISTFATWMCKNEGWEMKLRGIAGKYFCQFFGANNIEEKPFSSMEGFDQIKHATVWAIKTALETYSDNPKEIEDLI